MKSQLNGPGSSYVKIVADSISEASGDRVTSFEVRMWRFTLAEMNTHCVFARNSASSRAIPVTKQLQRYRDDPAYFHEWPAEQKGMQGGAQLGGDPLSDARTLAIKIHGQTSAAVDNYLRQHPDLETRLHKSALNRFLEPLQWHTALITASSWQNFFDQRVNPAAQPELRVVAELMKELHDSGEPEALERGQWHLPYIQLGGDEAVVNHELSQLNGSEFVFTGCDAREISAARCARLSYLTQDGKRDPQLDKELYDRLVKQHHWSPLEHVCTPQAGNQIRVSSPDPDSGVSLPAVFLPVQGKFLGWQQWRHVVEGRMKIFTYR